MYDEITEKLLNETDTQREKLKKMVKELEDLTTKAESLFPRILDARNVRFFQERVKTISELYKTILETIKEINKSVKDEIEIRRKLETKDNTDFDELFDIRRLMKKVEPLMKKSEQLKEDFKNAEAQKYDTLVRSAEIGEE